MNKNMAWHLIEDNGVATTVLTPNRRLAATLNQHYQHHRQTQGNVFWQTADILPITTWIERCYQQAAVQQLTPLPIILSSTQENYLWEKIINETPAAASLLQISQTATLVKSAWQLLQQWLIDLNDAAFSLTEDYQTLQQWARLFEAYCKKNHLIDNASLPTYLIRFIKEKKLALPDQIMLVGFNELSPQLQQLFMVCEENGCKILHQKETTHAISAQQISLQDQEDEIRTAARYAKHLHHTHPNATIGCVFPNLDKIRDRVVQIFSECFAPLNKIACDPTNSVFNISAGKPITHYPIIQAAFQLLGLEKKKISMATLSYILLTPFVGAAEKERIKRAQYDAFLRKKNINQFHVEDDANLANNCPLLAKQCKLFFAKLNDGPKKMTYREWAYFFNELLALLGWPGERSLNSEEYQITHAWLDILTEFTTLHLFTQVVSYQEALFALKKMADKITFQPKTPAAPIQILGLLEAAGLPFDYVWIAGMDDVAFPPQPKPNPFIPKSLQREWQMPHATSERELIYCQQLIEQFLQSTSHLIFSHAKKQDELELEASPLIRHFPIVQRDSLPLSHDVLPHERLIASKQFEIYQDESGPAHAPNSLVRGGVNVIKQQALCPFRAFAQWRLHAEALEQPAPGLKSKDRGILVHQVLELVWNQIQSHAHLIEMEEKTLEQLLKNCIDQVLIKNSYSHSPNSAYLKLEKKRLYKLVSAWLEIEKSRPPFTVLANEKTMQIPLKQLTFDIKIDRIDELENGAKIIIDYKTGKNNSINTWFSTRPEEPQLPLYALTDTENTAAITFAQIAPGEMVFKGISQFDLEMKGIKEIAKHNKNEPTTWEEQLSHWRHTLEKLSDDFYQGSAQVDPKEAEKTCQWCALQAFCRINETVLSS